MIDKKEIEIFHALHFLKQQSQCIDKQVACIITNADYEIMSYGVNEIIKCDKNCDDKENRTCEVIHAEVVAVNNLNRRYTSVIEGTCKAWLTLFPCAPCQKALEGFVNEIIVFGPKHKDQVFENIRIEENFTEKLLDYNGEGQPSIIQGELAELISAIGNYFYRPDKPNNINEVLDEIVDVENQVILLKDLLWRYDKDIYNKLRTMRENKTYDLFGKLIAGLL